MAPKKQANKKEVEPKKKESKVTKGVEKKSKAKKEPTKTETKKTKTPKKAETTVAATEPEVPAKTTPARKTTAKKEAKSKAEKPAKTSTPKTKAAEKAKVTKTKAAPKAKKEPKSPKKEPKSPKKEPKSPKSPKKAAETKAENGKAETKKEAKSGKLEVGEPIFEFELETDESTDSNPVKVSITEVLKDNGVVIFFYPKANTPGCTKQACGFRDDYDEYVAGGYQVFGMSADKPKAQKSWKEKQGFKYTLLCDPTFEVLSKLGVASAKKITRSHIIIEKGNTVKDISIGVKPEDSVKNAKAAVL